MENLVELILNNGMSVVLVGYFIFKDYKFNENILGALHEVKEVLSGMKEVISVLKEFHDLKS